MVTSCLMSSVADALQPGHQAVLVRVEYTLEARFARSKRACTGSVRQISLSVDIFTDGWAFTGCLVLNSS